MNQYRNKTEAELRFIVKDAGEARDLAWQNEDLRAYNKYADQVNDAVTELYRRRQIVRGL